MKTFARRFTSILFGVFAVTMIFAGIGQAAQSHKSQPKAAGSHAKITLSQANAVAVKKFPGKIVGKTKLENEEGVWQYGVMVQSGKTLREIMVNAKTGKIDNVEVTSASKERVEAKTDAAKAKATSKVTSTKTKSENKTGVKSK
ncbi:MAG TPA: PepSY domain-containing protein [Armatimonadota bacterium]|jgi:hypothetical protein